MEQPKILKILNGEQLPSIFSTEEMENRFLRLRYHMDHRGIDAVLFTSFHNINYFDHFVYTSFSRNYGLVVTPQRSAPSQRTMMAVSLGDVDSETIWSIRIGNETIFLLLSESC